MAIHITVFALSLWYTVMPCGSGTSNCCLCLGWPSHYQAGDLPILCASCDHSRDLQIPSDEAATGPNQYYHLGAGLGVSPSLHPFPPQALLTCSQPPCQPFWLSQTTNPPHKLQLVVLLSLPCSLPCPGHSVEESSQAASLLSGPLIILSGDGIWAGLQAVDGLVHGHAKSPQACMVLMVPPLDGGGI